MVANNATRDGDIAVGSILLQDDAYHWFVIMLRCIAANNCHHDNNYKRENEEN
jgi:hypothetical protein